MLVAVGLWASVIQKRPKKPLSLSRYLEDDVSQPWNEKAERTMLKCIKCSFNEYHCGPVNCKRWEQYQSTAHRTTYHGSCVINTNHTAVGNYTAKPNVLAHHLYIRQHNTVRGNSCLCSYLSFLKTIRGSKPSTSCRCRYVKTKQNGNSMTGCTSLLCETLGNSTCSNFISHKGKVILLQARCGPEGG